MVLQYMETDQLPQALKKWFDENVDSLQVQRISGIRTATSGLSNITLFFHVDGEQAGKPISRGYVLRLPPERETVFSADFLFQCQMMWALAPTGLKVPEVYWYESEKAYLGCEFYIMEKISGESPGDAYPGFHGAGVFYDAVVTDRTTLWRDAIDQLVALHALDWHTLSLPDDMYFPKDAADALRAQIESLEKMYARVTKVRIPIIEHTLQWLSTQTWVPEKTSLLWGDARPGNMLFDGNSVVANLDWESASIGPPEFDLAYFMVSVELSADFCQVDRLPGLMSEEDTIQYYLAASGSQRDGIPYAFIFTYCRLAIMTALHVQSPPDDLVLPESFYFDNYCVRQLAAHLPV